MGKSNAVEKADALNKKGEGLFITSVTVFELWHGLNPENEEKREKLEKFIESFGLFQLDKESAKRGGEIHQRLISSGERINPEDSMIAGIALHNGQTLLTADKHFSRINGLKTESY